MRKARKIAQLQRLTDMVLEAELTALKKVDAQRQDTLAKMEGLSAAPAMMDADTGAAGAVAALRYQSWADARRADLGQVLARQTAQWLDMRDQARRAFGRARGVDQVADKLAAKKP
jgi:hypothetical protein